MAKSAISATMIAAIFLLAALSGGIAGVVGIADTAGAQETQETQEMQGAALMAEPTATEKPAPVMYRQWKNGPPSNPKFFPIAVWAQSPRMAPRYKEVGINTYVGLHNGPTEEQLAELKKHGMYVVCHQNEVGLKHKNEKMIIAWMHGDEPDNAKSTTKYWKSGEAIKAAWPELPLKSLEEWGGWGPPVSPRKIIADYGQLKKNDPTRPVLLNLGQGVAWDNWHGRGVRTNKPEDYPQYVRGADIVSYDIYPTNQDKPQVKDQHWMVPYGVKRLINWTGGKKPIWNVVECTGYNKPSGRPSPEVVRSQVWMSLINGSQGIVYFVHVFKPQFIEAGLLADKEMAEAVGKLNRQITELAPVLNSPNVERLATVNSSNKETPINMMVKRHEGSIYLMTAAVGAGEARGSFTVKGLTGKIEAEVLGEDRKVELVGGRFEDDFSGYGVHLYRIPAAAVSGRR